MIEPRRIAPALKSPANVRNFCIIAHIDHGKTTLSDRLLEVTRTIEQRQIGEQMLDAMDLERERGITIKMHPVTLSLHRRRRADVRAQLHRHARARRFSVRKSRARSRPAKARCWSSTPRKGSKRRRWPTIISRSSNNLTIIPVINKIDLPAADPERVKNEIEELLIIEGSDAILASAKEGIGISEILEAIVHAHSGAERQHRSPARLGVRRAVRSVSRRRGLRARRRRRAQGRARSSCRWRTSASTKPPKSACSNRRCVKTGELEIGNVGYVIANIKSLGEMDVGDTITEAANPALEPLPGYKPIVPMVYCGLYPNEGVEVSDLRDALEKLALNDSALHFEPESSIALGFGFRCGFLGLLHMEIVQERLERNYNLDLIATSPSVVFRVTLTDGTVADHRQSGEAAGPRQDRTDGRAVRQGDGDHAARVRRRDHGAHAEPARHAQEHGVSHRRARDPHLRDAAHRSHHRLLRSAQVAHQGLCLARLRAHRLPRRRFGETRDLAQRRVGRRALVHRRARQGRDRAGALLTEKLKELIPRQMFDVPIQAAIGGKIVARETVSAMRKNVLAKCYGGDITRKRKLLEKQKAGKERMKRVGRVDLPQEAFMAVLRLDEE